MNAEILTWLKNHPAPMPLRAHEPLSILIAEDNDANRLIARAILEKDGHQVDTAINGETAIKACASGSYDVILLDILMPVMDGLKTLRRIRALRHGQNKTPIFALTAYCSPADQHRYRLAGFDGIIPKPLRRGQLEALLQKYSQGHVPLAPVKKTKTISPSNEQPILDSQIIAQLRDIQNAQAIEDVQSKFWLSIKQSLGAISAEKHAALEGNMDAITRLRGSVHAIKGACSTIGLYRASHIARALQNAPSGDIPVLLKQLCECLSDSKPILSEALQL